MCLTKQQTIKWFRIINWKTKMLDKISKSNNHNWKKHKKYQYLYLLEKVLVLDYRNDFFDMKIDNKVNFYYNWLKRINRKYKYV